jgi:integrase
VSSPQVITLSLVTGQSVRVEFTGNVTISVATSTVSGHSEGMSPAAVEAARTEAAPPPSLRISKPPACSLMSAIDEWLDHMRLRRKKPKSVEAFKQIAYRAMREMGWREVSDLTHDNITAWITKAAAENNWKGATVNHRMTALHGLTERLYKRGLLPHDPLADAIRADEDDSSEGARAATLDEARALILRAWIREQNDRRCKGNRTLYWACLFAMGCRLDEPARWKWKHVQLDMDPPRVCWTPDINKGKKRREQPIPGWLADALRKHKRNAERNATACASTPQHSENPLENEDACLRERLRTQHETQHSIDPESPVFPVIPNKATFAADREQAGIPLEDYRGRKFTPHAARKFYATYLMLQHVPKDLKDYLMRHSGSVEACYIDPPMSECAAAVAKIPNLLPDVMGPDRKSSQPNDCDPKDLRDADEKSFTKPIATGDAGRYSVSGAAQPKHSSESVSRSAPPPRVAPPSHEGTGPEHDPDSFGGKPGETSGKFDPEPLRARNRQCQDIAGADPIALADFLESLARLLRQGACNGRSTGQSPAGQPGPSTT